MTTTSLASIENILPHRGTMLFQDEVRRYTEQETVCAFTIPANGWYADATNAMPAWLGVEIMAQAVAAHVALTAIRAGRNPKPGALLGTRDFKSSLPAFPAGKTLITRAVMEFIDESGLGVYQCHIAIDDQEISTATLKVYEPDDFDHFLATGTQSS